MKLRHLLCATLLSTAVSAVYAQTAPAAPATAGTPAAPPKVGSIKGDAWVHSS